MATVFLFDAVGTVIHPEPNVFKVYHRAGAAFGSQLTQEQIKERFTKARRERFHVGVAAESVVARSLPSSEALEHQLWQELVTDIFTDVEDVDALFEHLWSYFADPVNWRLYNDVVPCFKWLTQSGYRVGIASNFDSRLHAILKTFPIFELTSFVFCSGELGFRKPDPEFYRLAAEAIHEVAPAASIMMLGNEGQNDYTAPKLAGWDAFLVDRRKGRKLGPSTVASLNELRNF